MNAAAKAGAAEPPFAAFSGFFGAGWRRQSFFALRSAQVFEKVRSGRANPRKSKEIQGKYFARLCPVSSLLGSFRIEFGLA
jgi:hypothetical protein